MADHGWERLLVHDGRIRVDLALRSDSWVRHVQSGYRPNWRPAGVMPENPMEGPLMIDETARLAPGEAARVTVFPLLPQHWQGVQPGDHLEMLDLRGRVLGDGRVIEVVDLPPTAQLPAHGTV